MNKLSRNRPVGFVVGAAGFIGSHLVEELLSKNIQVIGVDNFSTGHRDNLIEAVKNKDFELISQELPLMKNMELPRLAYAVFLITETENNFKFQQSFKSFVNYCKNLNPKIILCSSIDLYDSNKSTDANLRFAESYIAREALDHKINARVVRLSAVYGPRMHFRGSDPIIRLIKSAIADKLNQETSPLEFTTRALYVKDAVRLLIKAIMHGSTSQKIYDGALDQPVKVSEIKQVLMDPLWYEEKGFKPTILPPWVTPNLNKTCRELSWKPSSDTVTSLKETLAFFNLHKDKIHSLSAETKNIEEKGEIREEEPKNEEKLKTKNEIIYTFPKINFKKIKSKFIVLAGLAIILFALVFPFFKFGFDALMAKNHWENSINNMMVGDFVSAEKESKDALGNIQSLNTSFEKIAFTKQIDAINKPYLSAEQILKIGNKVFEANYHTILGAKSLSSGLSVVSGEKTGDSLKLFADAKTELETADSKLGEVSAELKDNAYLNNLPVYLEGTFSDLENKTLSYRQTIGLGKTLVNLLPQIIATDGQKNYLIVLQDNRILRPGGGVLRAYVEVTFDHGRLLKIQADSVENLDRQFSDRIEPPLELKADLGESNWRLKDGSYDLDFPTSAHNIAWFFNKESKDKVSGVIAIDLEAASKLLEAMGSKNNISTKIALGREGNQVAAEVLKDLVERVFYLSKQNWVVLAKNSSESLKEKNLLIYLTDPVAFSYLSSNGWTGIFPLQEKDIAGEKIEFLAFSETNMSAGQDSSAIKRSSSLQTKIDAIGIVSHKFMINFSATEKLSGKYRNRFKIYLPANTKLIKSTWGGKVLKDINPFSDYGRSGLSMLLELGVGEQKQLILEYQDTSRLKFSDDELKYYLNIYKQPSQESIPFEYKLSFPPEYKVETTLDKGLGEVSIKSDLSEDRAYEIILKK